MVNVTEINRNGAFILARTLQVLFEGSDIKICAGGEVIQEDNILVFA